MILDARNKQGTRRSADGEEEFVEPSITHASPHLFPAQGECVSRIHNQLQHLANIKAGTRFSTSGPRPTREQLSTIIETAFWASLRPNEGRMTQVRLTFLSPEQVSDNIVFASPVSFDDSAIIKLAPAVPQGCCLGTIMVGEGMKIWGFARESIIRALDTVIIEIAEPGTVRVDIGPFRPYMVLNGRSNDVIEATGSDLAHNLRIKLGKALAAEDFLETQAVWRECIALADLVRMILHDGHGGAVLLVPSVNGGWSDSLDPFPYRLKTPDSTIRAIRRELNQSSELGEVFTELSSADIPGDLKNRIVGAFHQNDGSAKLSAVEVVATLARVDGAVVMTRDLQLLGFGGKIAFKPNVDVPVCKFRPTHGGQQVARLRLEAVGGMRHQSAARFIADNKECVAIVVSQDRHVSLMNWDNALEAVCVISNAEWWV
jgi:hypothetical protein